MKTFLSIVAAVSLVAALAFGAWAHYAGPCYLFKYTKTADIPGRCVMK